MRTISTPELERLLASGDDAGVVLNVVPPEYHAAMHIPGSLNIAVYETSFLAQISQAISSKATPIVAYGRNRYFGAAERACVLLAGAGYSDVRVYEEGIEGWREAGNNVAGTLVTEEERLPDGHYQLVQGESYVQWEGSNIVNRR